MDEVVDLYTQAGPVRVSKPGQEAFERPAYNRPEFFQIYKAGRDYLRKLKASGEWKELTDGSSSL